MLNPNRFPGSLFRAWRFSSWRDTLRALFASAGILAFALAVFVAVHHAPYATASDAGPLAVNVVRSAIDTNWRQRGTRSMAAAS